MVGFVLGRSTSPEIQPIFVHAYYPVPTIRDLKGSSDAMV